MSGIDKLDAYHLLCLAESGRPVETTAQWLASWFLSGELNGKEIDQEVKQIWARTASLLLDPSEVWETLLPGGPTSLSETYVTMTSSEWKHLKDLEVAQDEPVASRAVDLEPQDPYHYVVSIWKHQDIDGPAEVIDTARDHFTESPLNLADVVIEEMTVQNRRRNYLQKENMFAWITHRESGRDFIMEWEQANVIKDLEGVIKQIEDITSDHPEFNVAIPDFSDEFQGIQDQMAIAGEEFVKTHGK
jgi:hypothetical protein